MELVCPICNDMVVYLLRCPQCGKQMKNKGTITEFLDDYSAYLDLNITQRVDGVAYDKCVHLFYCENCNCDKRIAVQRVKI